MCVGLRNKDISSRPLLVQLQDLEDLQSGSLLQWTQASVWNGEGRLLLHGTCLLKYLCEVCVSESLTLTLRGI